MNQEICGLNEILGIVWCPETRHNVMCDFAEIEVIWYIKIT